MSSLIKTNSIPAVLQNIETLRNFLHRYNSIRLKRRRDTDPLSEESPTPQKFVKPNEEIKPIIGVGYQYQSMIPPINSNINRSTSYPKYPKYLGVQPDPRYAPQSIPQPVVVQKPSYRVVPCVMFHSPIGCKFGDKCSFIHAQNFAGKETPNMHRYVRPFHLLSSNHNNNVINMLALKKVLNSSSSEFSPVNNNESQSRNFLLPEELPSLQSLLKSIQSQKTLKKG